MNAEPQRLAVLVTSRIELIDEICEKVSGFLQRLSIEPDDIYALDLSVREAVVNAMKHGNNFDPRFEVGVLAEVAGEDCMIRVRDSGKSGKSLANSPGELLAPKGRGLLIMRSLMDSVESCRQKYGFEVVLRKRVRITSEARSLR